MQAGRAYDGIALRYQERKESAAPASWSEHLLRRWSQAIPRPGRVLDLGCGHGFELARMREDGLRAVGLDLSLGMLRLARQRAEGRLVQGDATRLPLGTATFDGCGRCMRSCTFQP